MITNERQYRIAKARIATAAAELRQFDEIDLARRGIDPILITTERASLELELRELEKDIARYEELRGGAVRKLSFDRIKDLGAKLIEARIVAGLSQRELGERLGMKEQQVQRYEHDRYLTANLTRCAEVAEALHLEISAHLEVRQPNFFDQLTPNWAHHASDILLDAAKFPVKEMKRRGWLDEVDQRASAPAASDEELAAAFIRQALSGRSLVALHKENIRAGAMQDDHARLAWKARVLSRARRLDLDRRKGPYLDMAAVRRLAEMSVRDDGPREAVALLRERGIAIVFVEHLPRMHLDGAAMLLDDSVPVIGMTLRFNRADSFWFVLLHECAHILLHAERGLRDGFFDEDGTPARSELEKEADDYARNALIPSELWKRSLVRFTTSRDEVMQFADKNKVGVPVVAGRIRRERNDYSLFSDLVGQGEIKKLVEAAGYWER